MSKENYYQKSISQYSAIRSKCEKGTLPKLLLHVCCGACSCFPLIWLSELFDITIFFSNPNIYPYEEYQKRLDALKKMVNEVEGIFGKKIQIIEDTYDNDKFKEILKPYADEKEGGTRCKICIASRIERSFKFASSNGFSYVTTVMSISRNKDVDYLNTIGVKISERFPSVEYFVSDFKKNNGQELGILLSKKYDIYRQNYCGCQYSQKSN